jgi:hypothetical protein
MLFHNPNNFKVKQKVFAATIKQLQSIAFLKPQNRSHSQPGILSTNGTPSFSPSNPRRKQGNHKRIDAPDPCLKCNP